MHRGLQLVMAILMIAAIYCTFRYRVLPSSAGSQPSKKVVVIDPGHGGEDPGKVSTEGVLEKDVNLAISGRLKSALEDAGYEVILTRENDNGLYDENASNKKITDMKKRCEIIENANADIVVSIHQNSFSQESVHGAQVFYYEYSTEGKVLAEKIQSSIKQIADSDNGRAAKSNSTYYMLVHTPCPTVIVECGFLSNGQETKQLLSDDYQEKIAEAICAGVNMYFEKSTGQEKGNVQ